MVVSSSTCHVEQSQDIACLKLIAIINFSTSLEVTKNIKAAFRNYFLCNIFL